MKYKDRYIPSGKLQGDDGVLVDKGGSKAGDYEKSLGEASRSNLDAGFIPMGKLKGAGSDEKNFA